MKGGARKGAGRPKGGKNKATLEKKAVLEAFNQRVMIQADALFNAQLTLAVGSMKVFRVDETKENGKAKREHVHVTDVDEIKALLDEHGGAPGVVEGVYYYFTDVLPDNKALDSMLNRALGKPPDKIVFDPNELDAAIEQQLARLAARGETDISGEAEGEIVH